MGKALPDKVLFSHAEAAAILGLDPLRWAKLAFRLRSEGRLRIIAIDGEEKIPAVDLWRIVNSGTDGRTVARKNGAVSIAHAISEFLADKYGN